MQNNKHIKPVNVNYDFRFHLCTTYYQWRRNKMLFNLPGIWMYNDVNANK
jgi:hypothetical protein